MLGLLLVAAGLGASNFAAAIGIGIGGVDSRTRIRVGLVFGLFEAAMPLVGLALGRVVSHQLGSTGHVVGAILLVVVGGYTIAQGLRSGHGNHLGTKRAGRLLLTGLALSIDNLVVGFALGTLHIEFALAAAVIAVVSVGMSLVGLEIGGRVGSAFERRGELVGGAVLIAVGVALGTGLLG
jgi:manganese efflux pump family protein